MSASLADLELPPGADPVLRYARPDVVELVYRAIKPLGGVVTWEYTAADGGASGYGRTGGGVPIPPGLAGWLVTVSLQVDIRAHNKAAARRRADAARRAICALPWAEWSGGVIARADVLEGPFWLPDENNAPRYVARYAITAHPVPTPRREPRS